MKLRPMACRLCAQRCPVMLLMLCEFLVQHSAAADAKKSLPKPLILNLGDIFDITGKRQGEPVRKLSQALVKHPSTWLFREVWSDGIANYTNTATVLYNRQTNVLTFFTKFYVGGMGNEDIPSPQVENWKLLGVKPWMIHKLAHKRQAENASEDSYFAQLASYGCQRVNISLPPGYSYRTDEITPQATQRRSGWRRKSRRQK